MKTVYQTATEAAKGLRQELKTTFPGIKFSVRTSYFANGNSIDISWVLGPTKDMVEAITRKYQYGWFDGMTDCYNNEDTLVADKSGEVKILGGAKFVGNTRSIPDEIYNPLLKQFCETMNDCYYNEKEPWNSCFKDAAGNYNGSASVHLNIIFGYTDFRLVKEFKLIWSEKTDRFEVV